MNYSQKAIELVSQAESKLDFSRVKDIALHNQSKVLDAFREHKLSYRHFAPTNGYGYGDEGRDVLNSVYSQVFDTEDAIVSPYIASGTHAINLMLTGILRPNDTLLSIGTPYDTIQTAIKGNGIGSLIEYGINYKELQLINGQFDYDTIMTSLKGVSVVYITRSRGYEWRDALSMDSIEKVIKLIKSVSKDIIVAIDNCYGEFVDYIEPTTVGADLIAGSLIKNPGGGLAPNGGYIAGRKDLIEMISYKLTSPGLGREVGSYAHGYQLYYQGLFMAPTTVMNAMQGSMLMGQAFSDLGLETMPVVGSVCRDIVVSIKFLDKESLIAFCRSIQAVSPIDSYVQLEPWAMPGYDCDVIMAAGTFTAGSSIELSADSPIKEPYIAYMQGGLTYEHAKIACIHSVDRYLSRNS